MGSRKTLKATVKVRRTRTGKTTATASKTLRQAIQKVIKGTSETKYVAEACRNLSGTSSLGTWTVFSSGITAVAEIYAAIPRVAQGVDEHQRIGDVINPTSCSIHLDFTTPAYNENESIDKTVHVYLMEAASVKDLANYSAIPISQLLDNGQGGNVGFDGTALAAMLPVQNKTFRVLKHKTFRLVKGFGRTQGSSSTDLAGVTDSVISPSQSYKRISMRVKLPKKLKYEGVNARYPTNSAPFFVVGWTNNWAVDAASNVINLKVLGRTEMHYKDV